MSPLNCEAKQLKNAAVLQRNAFLGRFSQTIGPDAAFMLELFS